MQLLLSFTSVVFEGHKPCSANDESEKAKQVSEAAKQQKIKLKKFEMLEWEKL